MKRIWAGVVVLVVIVMAAVAFADETLKLPTADEVLAKMKTKWAGMKSLEMDMTTTPKSVALSGIGHVIIERWEGGSGERSVSTRKWVMTNLGPGVPPGNDKIEERKVVNDGTYIWIEKRVPGEEIRVDKEDATKSSAGNMLGMYPMMLEQNTKKYGLKVIGEDILEGQKMYVLEGSFKFSVNDYDVAYMKVWVGERDLVLHRMSVKPEDKQGLLGERTDDYSNVKVDTKIDPKVFEYTPPEGAVVKDLTKAGAPN